MAVTHMVGIVSPILRSLRTHNIYGLGRFVDADDRSLRFEDHAIVCLQDRPAGKRNGELQPVIRGATPVALTPLFPSESERVAAVVGVLRTNVRGLDGFLDDRHISKRENSVAPVGESR